MGVVDLHPPSFAFVAFIEIDGFILDHDDILLVVALRLKRKLIDSQVITLDEIPDHLGDEVGCLLPVIMLGVVFVDSKGGYLPAQTCIPGDRTNLFPVKTVGRRVVVTGCVSHSHGTQVDAHQVCVPQHRFDLRQVRGYLTEAIGLKKSRSIRSISSCELKNV